MLDDILRGMRLSMAVGARDWDHFMATLWGESLKADALRVWDVALIEILHSHLPCQVWYDMMVARYGRLIADAKQQRNQQEKYGNSRDALNTKKNLFFFPTQIHLHNAKVCVCGCGCALDYSAVFSLCCLLPLYPYPMPSSPNMLARSTPHGVESSAGHLLCNKTSSRSCR